MSKKNEEEGSSRRRYNEDDNNDDDKDMDGRGRDGEGEEEGWWNDHRRTRHGQHLCLPPGNDDRGYDDEDIPVILASDLSKAADHFLAVAVSSSAFSSSLSSLPLLLKAAVAAASQRGDNGFLAVSVGNDDNGND
jgi:hypothetical protein